jgi:hypothetical protein
MERLGAPALSTAAAAPFRFALVLMLALVVPTVLALAAAAVGPAAPRGEKDVLAPAVARALESSRKRVEQQQEWWPTHSSWDDPWITTSDHYQVKQTRAYWAGKRIAEDLERWWPRFEEVLGEATPLAEPFLIEIHPDLAAYNRVGTTIQDNATAYHTSFLGSFFTSELPGRPVVTYDPGDDETLARHITHSAAHQYLAAFGRPREALPSWQVEGVAGFLEMVWDPIYGERNLARFRAMIDRGFALPLPRLIALTPDQWSRDRIQQAALLFHFLWNVFDETADVRNEAGEVVLPGPFREWWTMKLRGEDVRQHPVEALLRDELPRLDAELRRWAKP